MFRAIGRLFRTIAYLFTGRIDRISAIWGKNPDVIAAKYDSVVNEKRKRLTQYTSAVGGLIVAEEKKKNKLKDLTDDITKFEKLRAGALNKAKAIAATLDEAAAKAHPDYIKCLSAYKDFSSTLEEKQKYVADLETEIKTLSQGIANHKTSIEGLMRDLEKIKDEKYETMADIVSADEEKKIADMFNGIGEDKTDEDLKQLRDSRTRAKADARMSRELAGMDSKKSEEDFLSYASNSSVQDEFDKLIFNTQKDSSVKSEATKVLE